MAFVVKDRVKETSTTTGTGTLTLAGAVSGFRSFADIGNSNTTAYVILEGSESTPTAWEVGIGTYTASGTTLSRDTVLRTSAGNTTKITLGAGTHTVLCGWPADYGLGSDFAQHAVTPGGRLTLTSGTPVTTSDVTGATSIYYTPYVSNVISLWTGARWQPIEFSEYTLALGTLSSGKPYDVFAYLNAGALALEMLAWTNDTTRATAITIQDGRYCKSGDKTRLYLGTFYTTSTTATEDSAAKRYLWNFYNRSNRKLTISSTSVHTYTTATWREWSGGGSQVKFVFGLAEDSIQVSAFATISNGVGEVVGRIGIGLNSTTTIANTFEEQEYSNNSGNYMGVNADVVVTPALGLNYLAGLQYGMTNNSYLHIELNSMVRS